MKTILFYWGKGAQTRIKILKLVYSCEKNNHPCFLNFIASNLGLSHVGLKKQVDLLTEEGYLKMLNPDGKPVFLSLTKKGQEIIKEFGFK